MLVHSTWTPIALSLIWSKVRVGSIDQLEELADNIEALPYLGDYVRELELGLMEETGLDKRVVKRIPIATTRLLSLTPLLQSLKCWGIKLEGMDFSHLIREFPFVFLSLPPRATACSLPLRLRRADLKNLSIYPLRDDETGFSKSPILQQICMNSQGFLNSTIHSLCPALTSFELSLGNLSWQNWSSIKRDQSVIAIKAQGVLSLSLNNIVHDHITNPVLLCSWFKLFPSLIALRSLNLESNQIFLPYRTIFNRLPPSLSYLCSSIHNPSTRLANENSEAFNPSLLEALLQRILPFTLRVIHLRCTAGLKSKVWDSEFTKEEYEVDDEVIAKCAEAGIRLQCGGGNR